MSFEIVGYDRSHLPAMMDLFKRQTAGEPFIAPLTPDLFVALVEEKSYFDPEGLLVAVDGGEVVGWIHACVAPGSEARHDPADHVPRIRLLIYPPERLTVGHALVAEATAWLQRTGREELLAMHSAAGYPFYRGLWLGGEPKCPATMPHLQLAFEVAGYNNTLESVGMVAAMPDPPPAIEAALPLDLVDAPAEMAHEPMRESWIGFEPRVTAAMIDGERVGRIAWVLIPYVAERLGAPCMNIWGLGVDEEHRRKGIATALIAHAMRGSHALGARFASVSTQLWNWPAQRTYAALGFVPYTITVGRTLRPEGDA